VRLHYFGPLTKNINRRPELVSGPLTKNTKTVILNLFQDPMSVAPQAEHQTFATLLFRHHCYS
jgi:hypothetical protein